MKFVKTKHNFNFKECGNQQVTSISLLIKQIFHQIYNMKWYKDSIARNVEITNDVFFFLLWYLIESHHGENLMGLSVAHILTMYLG